MEGSYKVCEGLDYQIAVAKAKARVFEIQELDNQVFLMTEHEIQIQKLLDLGLTPAEALRELRAQREEERRAVRLSNQTGQFEKRNSQANFRIGVSVARFLKMLFK